MRRRVVRLFAPPASYVAHAAARLQLVPPPRRCSTRARPDTCRACSLTPRHAAARTPAVLRSALMLTCQAGPLACMRAVHRWRAGAELSGAAGGAAIRRRHVPALQRCSVCQYTAHAARPGVPVQSAAPLLCLEGGRQAEALRWSPVSQDVLATASSADSDLHLFDLGICDEDIPTTTLVGDPQVCPRHASCDGCAAASC